MVKFVFSLLIALYAISGRANDLRVTYDINTKKLVLETPSSGKKVDLVLLEKPLRVSYCLIRFNLCETVLFLDVAYDPGEDYYYRLVQMEKTDKSTFVDLGKIRFDQFDPFLHCSELQEMCWNDLGCPVGEGQSQLKYVDCFTCRFEEYELEESSLQDGKMTATIEIDWAMPEVVKRAYKKRYPQKNDLFFSGDDLRAITSSAADLQLTARGLSAKDRSFESALSSSSSSVKVIRFGQGTLDVTPTETTFKFPLLQDLSIIQKNF